MNSEDARKIPKALPALSCRLSTILVSFDLQVSGAAFVSSANAIEFKTKSRVK